MKEYDNNEDVDRAKVAGLPLHYYLAQNKNVDIDTVKMMVEAYPESLTITTSLRESLCICYPIHALLYNKKINNIQEIIGYMLESNPTCLRVLNGENGTPLHVACQSKNVNLAIVEHLFNAWPEAMQMIDHSGWLPI